MEIPPRQTEAVDPEAFDFRKPFLRLQTVVLRHKALILITTLLTVAAMAAYIWWRPPVYAAEVTLMVEAKSDAPRDRFYDLWNVFRKDEAVNEAELLTGAPVLNETIDRLDLRFEEVYRPLTSQLRHAWTTSWIGKKYREIKYGLFPPKPQPFELTEEEKEKNLTLKDFKAGVSFSRANESYVGYLSVSGPTPRVAEMANTIVRVYIDQRTRRHVEEAEAAANALAAQVEDSRRRMNEAKDRVLQYREENGIYFDFEKEKALLAHWSEAGGLLLRQRAAMVRAERELEETESLLAAEAVNHVATRVTQLNSIKEAMRAGLLGHEQELAAKRLRYAPGAPELVEVEKLIADLRTRIAEAEDLVLSSEAHALNAVREGLRERRANLLAMLAGIRAEIDFLEASDAEFSRRLENVSAHERTMRELVRFVDEAVGEYHLLVARQRSAEISAMSRTQADPGLRIVGDAVPPSDPNWPNTKLLIAAALMTGFMLGVGLAFLRESLANPVRGYSLENRGDAPVYAEIAVRRRDLRQSLSASGNGGPPRNHS